MMNRNIDKYKFEDLFDMNKVQKLTDSIADALEIGIVIVSPEGTPITKPSNFCRFCLDVVRRSEIGNRNCEYSDSVLGRKSDKPIVSKCLSAGLMDAGISIIIDGKHLASWMIGQVMIEEDMLSVAEQRERAQALEIDEELFLEKIQTVPRKTRAQFNNIVEMIRVLAMQLSELGMQSYIQQEELAYRKEIETELRSEKIKLELSHQHDELTGLLSKARFDEKLKKLVQDKAYPIVFFAGDMNNLKLCNDVFGHRIGDAALKAVADILRKEAGVDYIIGRRSGDEFCIAIPYGRALEAEDYCSRIHKACAEVSNTMLPPSLSLGYAILKSEEDDLRSVMNQAEEAMYNAKVQRKRKQNIHNDIMELLYQKQYISKKQVAESVHRIERFSRYLNLEEYTVQMLRLSAKIQDVGLIAIPKHIVEKDAELTEKEYVEMSKHTLIGYRLARLYEESFPASNTILQSHECWSGMGYPNRLKGKEILYTARVLFMVTSYSYWIYPKPTGSGMDVAEARERLRQEAGKQFDPKLVDSFLEYLENEEPME